MILLVVDTQKGCFNENLYREVKQFVQGHTAGELQRQGWDLPD